MTLDLFLATAKVYCNIRGIDRPFIKTALTLVERSLMRPGEWYDETSIYGRGNAISG